MLAPLIFDSPLLASMLEAVESRGKAIRHYNSLERSREIDRGLERLNVDLRSIDSLKLRLSLWSDGLFWLSVNKPGPRGEKGWQINKQVEGAIGQWTPSEIVERLEATMIAPTDVSSIWRSNASNQAMQRTAGRSDV